MIDLQSQDARNPAPRADIGVLLVHGIGDHTEGETLVSFGEPLIDWLREWLRGQGGAQARGSVKVVQARMRATRTEAVSPAYAQVEVQLAGAPASAQAGAPADAPVGAPVGAPADAPAPERWLVTEAWWGDSVQPPRTLRLLGWLLTRGPLLIYWHFYLGPLRDAQTGAKRQMLLAGIALLLATLVQVVVLVAMVLWLIPFGPWRRAVSNAVRALTLTLGDSFVLLEQDFQSAALVRRVDRALNWLAQRADKLVVVAHSQGGAIAHEALRRLKTHQVVSFISIGSGLEKLHFLRHVRDKRGGLAAASLLGPLLLAGAATFIGAVAGGPDQRWIAGIGALVALAGLAMVVLLIVALNSYREELGEQMNGLDLRAALGPAEWHDLHATHDVVPMGDGSLMGKLGFITRHELKNQRSYLNDHVSYFENRMGCLPILWRLLARHSRLALFSDLDAARLDRALLLHNRQSWVLWFSGAASWAAVLLGLYALRAALPGFGASVLDALAAIGLGALVKPVQLAGKLLALGASRIGATGTLADATQLAPALLGALTLGAVMVGWWALFRAVWLLGSATDWRHACRAPGWLDQRGLGTWDAATLALRAGFGLVPLLVAGLLVAAPSDLTLALLAQSVAAVMSALCLAVACLYAVGVPWMRDSEALAGTADLSTRVLLPGASLLLAFAFIWAAQWFWPAAWSTLPMYVAATLVWLGMALSRGLWLARHGRAAYGRLWTGWLLLWPALATLALAHWRVVLLDPPAPVRDFNLLAVAMLSLAEVVQARALLLQLAGDLPWVRSLRERLRWR